MSKNIITESELRNKVASLREYMAVVEGGATNPAAQQQAPAAGQPSAATNLATGVGNALGTAAGVVAAPARAVWDAAKGVWNHAGDIGQGIAQGWNATDPAHMAGLDKPATGATQGTKPKWPTTPAEIGAFQKANGLKPDQLIGQKTLAALQKAGLKPPAGFTPVGSKPVQGTKPAPAASTPTAPQATNATANTTQGPNMGQVNPVATTPAPDDSEEGHAAFDPTWGGTVAPKDTRTGYEKIAPNFLGGKSAPVAANQNATWDNAQQRAVSNAPAQQPTSESVGYSEDQTLARIIQLAR